MYTDHLDLINLCSSSHFERDFFTPLNISFEDILSAILYPDPVPRLPFFAASQVNKVAVDGQGMDMRIT